LAYALQNRERVVSKDELISALWNGRIISETALTTCINAVRTAIGDSGELQHLIKTLPRKGIRFVGAVREAEKLATPVHVAANQSRAEIELPDKPSVAVLPFTNMSGDPEQDYFRRRHGRGHHHRALSLQLAVRDRAQLFLHLQG
jgi:adenylate cyclase